MTVGLILGAAVWENGPSPTLRRRVLHAALLFDQRKVTHLIACGGLGRHPPTEAAVIADLLQSVEVPAGQILREDQSHNTYQNISNALPLLAGLNCTDVIVITDAYHAPRARLIARRLGLIAFSSSPPLAGANPQQFLKSALREIPAYLVALVRV